MDPTSEGGVRTGFAETRDPAELAERGRKFLEPPPDAPRAARGELDLVMVPALAVTDGGHRLGYGVGFYDATLPDFCPPARSLLVAFEFQLLAELPVFEHDVACDLVVTDGRTIDARKLRPT
jgi:5-formyltetrahydrofolate cyclo-ligase